MASMLSAFASLCMPPLDGYTDPVPFVHVPNWQEATRHIKHVRTALCPKDYASSIYPQAQCCFSIVIYFWTETVLHQTGSKDEKRYSSLPMTNICEHIDCTNFFVLSHVFFTAVDLFCAHRVSSTSHTSL